MKVHVNSFVKRQTLESEYSHYGSLRHSAPWEHLRTQVERKLLKNIDVEPGYRDGVVLVHMSPRGFYTGVVQLVGGEQLCGFFKSRQEGESPRKSVGVVGAKKMPARAAYVVLYASTVLAENGDNELPSEPGNWEMISINASPVKGDMPINPMVLMHNHFGSDGGTETHLSDSEFVSKLRESFLFWRDKAMVMPSE